MCNVQQYTNQSPETKYGMFDGWPLLVEAEDPYRCIIQTVEHARSRSEVVELFSDVEVPRMKYHAKHPACHAHVAEPCIVSPQRVVTRYAVHHFCETTAVRQEVEKGEEDGEGFLDAEETVEWPFAMVLHDRLKHRRVAGEATVGNDVLADIVAIGGAGP